MALLYGVERNVKFSGLPCGHAYRNAWCELFEESVISGFRTTSAELAHGTLLATCIYFSLHRSCVGYGVAQLVGTSRKVAGSIPYCVIGIFH
jgi:hypothetical protein